MGPSSLVRRAKSTPTSLRHCASDPKPWSAHVTKSRNAAPTCCVVVTKILIVASERIAE